MEELIEMTLRERIKYTRIMYGLTQKNVGEALGTSRNYVTMIENGNGGVRASEERLIFILNLIYKLGESKKVGQMESIIKECIKNNIANNKDTE